MGGLAGLLCSFMRHPELGWDTHLRASVAAGTGACLAAGATPPSEELLARLSSQVQVTAGNSNESLDHQEPLRKTL